MAPSVATRSMIASSVETLASMEAEHWMVLIPWNSAAHIERNQRVLVAGCVLHGARIDAAEHDAEGVLRVVGSPNCVSTIAPVGHRLVDGSGVVQTRSRRSLQPGLHKALANEQ